MPRSIGEIEKLTTVELRKIVRDYMNKNPKLSFYGTDRDGNRTYMTAGRVGSHGKKEDLVNHLSKWEDSEQMKIEQAQREAMKTQKTPIVEQPLEPVSEIAEQIEPEVESVTTEPEPEIETEPEPETQPQILTEKSYTQSEAGKVKIAKHLYYATEKQDGLSGLREYMLNLAMNDAYFLPDFPILVSRARTLIEDYAIACSFTGNPNPATIDKTRNEILKYLGEIVIPEASRFPKVQGRGLQDIFEDFTKSVRLAFKDIRDLKVKADVSMNEAREDDVRTVIVSPFIEWAINTVKNLPSTANKWREVAISIMILTGRRQSEVLSSAIFTYVDASHITFEGQLKRHKDELVESAEIPVLGFMGQEVCEALEWLEQHNKRVLPVERTYNGLQLAAKQSHNRSSRYIAETMTNLSRLVQITNGKSWIKQAESPSQPDENLFKGHLCRQLYAQICATCFHNQKESKVRSYIAEILLENRKASLKYDRDIELDESDIQEVKELCGTLTN